MVLIKVGIVIRIEKKDCIDRLTSAYMRIEQLANEAMLKETGSGPYLNNPLRTHPWMDAEFYYRQAEWLKKEYKMINDVFNDNYYEFETEEHATFFRLATAK